MISDFSVEVDRTEASFPAVHVHGEIDIYTSPNLREALEKATENDVVDFVLDLEHVQYIDSTGLGTIAYTAQHLQQRNGTVFVVCKKPQIKKIFDVSGLLQKNVKLYESKEGITQTREA